MGDVYGELTVTLTFWQLLTLIGACSAVVLLSALVSGVLVYKTRYAGRPMFHGEHKPQAESFNIDDDFQDIDLEVGALKPDPLPQPIQEANDEFLKQFNMDRLIKEAEKYQE